jgi:hypothetical protein
MEKHPLHLKIPELQTSEEVTEAVEKQERLEGEELPNDPTERIEAYMSRLENIFLHEDERVKERNLEMLRPAIYDAFIIKPENVPESFFELQQRVARERGTPVENITPDMREQMIETIIEDQKASLDSWIDYLTSEDAVYPTWFKYFAFRNVVKLSQFDKELGKFKTRTETTTAPFPDIYREPLAQICDIYERVATDNKALKTDPELQTAFFKKFPTYYAELIQKSLASSIENKESIKGKWIKYSQGNAEDAETLYKSLESKGTGWCTAGLSTARTQIKAGDFYVFYTEVNGEPTQPRIAIRMNGTSEIGEIRGILPHQNLEEQMAPVLNEKLSEFGPEADKYKKKSADMKYLTEIEHKTTANKPLTKEDITFLYEINSTIEGFGNGKDSRITEIREKRNLNEDMLVLFNCEPNQIATKAEDLTENTVAYIGEWNTTTMQKIPKTIEYIYTKFPERRVFLKEIIPDPDINSTYTAISKLKAEGCTTGGYIDSLLANVNWQEELKSSYEVVSFSVADLFGNSYIHTFDDIKVKAQELGLDLIPQALAPSIRLNYPKKGQWTAMALKESIRDRGGDIRVFVCGGTGSTFWFSSHGCHAGGGWASDLELFFIRK